MPFDSLKTHSFRNLADAEIDTRAERIFLIGENGQGKTNFLEALYYLSFGASFRGSADSEAATGKEGSFQLSAMTRELIGNGMPAEEIRVGWNEGSKDIRRSGKKVNDRKELLESNPAIVFCHEDFSFASGEPERKRFFFDQTASLASTGYLDSLREYKRVLRQRNAALKDRRTSLLEFLDEQLVRHGLLLIEARTIMRSELAPRFSALYESVSRLGREVRLEYRPSWSENSSPDELVERLALKRDAELTMGTSLSGPHRDRWVFRSEAGDFTATASTGQLRLLSLVLRSVQASYYAEHVGKKPVLLLDDVLLEVDPQKRKRFFDSLPEASQAFFTFLPGEQWEDYQSDSMIVYRVCDGRFEDQGRLQPA